MLERSLATKEAGKIVGLLWVHLLIIIKLSSHSIQNAGFKSRGSP
jgi:hypothetical protein